MFWFIFMILIWFCYGWFYDFDMILIWLIFRALTLSQEPYVFSHPHHNNTKGPISDPELRYGFFPWPFLSACVGPPAPTRATQHRKPTTSNKHGTSLRPQQSHSQSWNMDGSDLKSQAQKNQIIYLCICHSRLTRIIPVRPCRLFLGSLGTSLWEAWEGEKGAGQLTRMSLILTLGLTCPFSEQNGAKWYWKLTSEWLTASD